MVNKGNMRKYIVSIVGRPNVGKSTLFNRLCRKRSAIVDFEPGVTRDRKYEDVDWNGKVFKIVDTGGIVFDSKESIDKMIKHQALLAIEESDLILFMVDAKTGTTDIDMQIAKILYPHRDKVMLVANKADNEKDEFELYSFLQLGFGDAFPIAANAGRNTGQFLDEVIMLIPDTADDVEDLGESITRIAVVGRPNVGKSSIINRLIGKEKLIVTEVAGTTRDTIDTHFRYDNKNYILVDTAGIRRKTRVNYGVEYFSVMRAIDAIDRADIIIVVLAADENVADQDLKIAAYAKRKMKEIIIVYNKWDLPDKDNSTTGKFISELHREMAFLQYAPVLFVSAKTGQRISKVMETVKLVEEESNKRIGTSDLNKFMESVVEHRPPTHPSGKHVRIYYITQAAVNPPTFIFFCNQPSLITENYRKYINNQLREMFSFTGASLRLIFKGRSKDEVS
ncbi:MAG: ribosome biogenesis GTPase Der [Candidatus Cloacimonadaceae bacterium]